VDADHVDGERADRHRDPERRAREAVAVGDEQELGRADGGDRGPVDEADLLVRGRRVAVGRQDPVVLGQPGQQLVPRRVAGDLLDDDQIEVEAGDQIGDDRGRVGGGREVLDVPARQIEGGGRADRGHQTRQRRSVAVDRAVVGAGVGGRAISQIAARRQERGEDHGGAGSHGHAFG
jgi:hypothetical protein